MPEAGTLIVQKPTGVEMTVIQVTMADSHIPFVWCEGGKPFKRHLLPLHQFIIQQGDEQMSDPTTAVETTLTSEPSESPAAQFSEMSFDEIKGLIKQVEIVAFLRWKKEVAEANLIEICRDCAKAYGQPAEDDRRNTVQWTEDDIEVVASLTHATLKVEYQGKLVLLNGNRSERIYVPGDWVQTILDKHTEAAAVLEARKEERLAQNRQEKIEQLLKLMEEYGFTELPTLSEPSFETDAYVKINWAEENHIHGLIGQVRNYDYYSDRFQVELKAKNYNLQEWSISPEHLEASSEADFKAQSTTKSVQPDSTEHQERYDLYCKLFREKPAIAAFIADALIVFSSHYAETTNLMVEVMQDTTADRNQRRIAAQTLSKISNQDSIAALLTGLDSDDETLTQLIVSVLVDWEQSDNYIY